MINARSGPRSPETVTAQPGSPREPQASAPPWAQPAQWIEAHKHLTGLCAAREAELGTLRLKAAQLVRALQLAVFPVMDQLCAETCPMCPDPCCLRAKPWFDFRDLILMHLAGLAIPGAQVLEDMTSTCRYSGPHGCTPAPVFQALDLHLVSLPGSESPAWPGPKNRPDLFDPHPAGGQEGKKRAGRPVHRTRVLQSGE